MNQSSILGDLQKNEWALIVNDEAIDATKPYRILKQLAEKKSDMQPATVSCIVYTVVCVVLSMCANLCFTTTHTSVDN